MTGTSKRRCAIYTRKSTEEGLEQDFNSLDAQREACEAFIASQAGLNWKLVPRRFDDGGVSGATMERPALQELLGDIAIGRVDVVVVYKIDRLTRSLMDFARIVESFDKHDVSFVSVTQQFNTTSSMGRLTLNVLLSFAQFEREVTAERIRDKIAASKKKGMWMGGLPPLGFDVCEKRLVVNQNEAPTVRKLFALYLEVKSVRRLKIEADELGLQTKRRVSGGIPSGGRPFFRGHLYNLLSNPLYVGEVAHKDQTYPGQHEAIIDRDTWDEVQRMLAANAASRNTMSNAKEPSLLAGLLYDETGDRLSPTHANKNGRRYRYYISHRLMLSSRDGNDGWRLPARELEKTVTNELTVRLSSEGWLFDLIPPSDLTPQIASAISKRAKALCSTLGFNDLSETRDLLQTIIERIDVSPGQLRLTIDTSALGSQLTDAAFAVKDKSICLEIPFTYRRRGVEGKLMVENGREPAARPDAQLIGVVSSGLKWFEQIVTGDTRTVREAAQRNQIDEGDISRMLNFAFLAPDIVVAIIAGKQPIELTAEKLKRLKNLPHSWTKQRKVLGFPG